MAKVTPSYVISAVRVRNAGRVVMSEQAGRGYCTRAVSPMSLTATAAHANSHPLRAVDLTASSVRTWPPELLSVIVTGAPSQLGFVATVTALMTCRTPHA